jgi:hypothetical protein
MTEAPGPLGRIFLDTEFVDDGRPVRPVSLARAGETRTDYTRSSLLAGIIQPADMTTTRAAHFESALAYVDSAGARTFTSTGPSGTIAHRPAAATRAGAWSQLLDIWIPPGATVPVPAFADREFSDYLAAWRGRSMFTQLGAWPQARQEQTR